MSLTLLNLSSLSLLHANLAPEKVNDEMTGFLHNAVCPFGLLHMADPDKMGGGEVDVKLGLPVSDFVRATGALVADVSAPRQGVEDVTED